MLLVGGLPCLDFVNSLDWRTSDKPVEYLNSFGDYLQWGSHAGVLSSQQSRRLARVQDAPARSAALRRAIAFREAAYRTLDAAMRRQPSEPADLRLIQETVRKAWANLRLDRAEGHFRWAFDEKQPNLDLPLWKLALSLEDLLTSPDLALVRECGGPGCGWLFLDSTKNRSRQWCSMRGCGNRAKARRFYDRYYR